MNAVQRSSPVISGASFIWIGCGLAFVYWFLESFVHIIFFGGGHLLEEVFTPDAHEIWKRLLVSVLVILFSLYAQRSLNIRKHTEKKLADREKELSLILENNPAAIVLVDAASRRIAWANSNAIKLIGSTKADIENQLCHKHLCPGEEGNCPILDGEMQSVDLSERALITSGGFKVPILKSVTRVHYDGSEHLLETFFDLSDRKKMERKLRQAHAELDQIFQTASVAMRLVDRDFQRVENQQHVRTTDRR